MKKNRIFRTSVLCIALSFVNTACDTPKPQGSLYFGAREIGPSVSIYSGKPSLGVKKITNDEKWRDLELDVAKNGDIVFISNRRDNFKINMNKQSEQYNIFLQSAEASTPTQISDSNFHDLSPRFSPDGGKIVFIRKSTPLEHLMVFERSTQKTHSLFSADTIIGHSWAPDGHKIAVAHISSGRSHLSIHNTSNSIGNSTSITPITLFVDKPKGAIDFIPNDTDPFLKSVEAPTWSPNGKHIAFILNPLYPKGVRQLKIYNAMTHAVTTISKNNAQVQSPVQWNHASDAILYSALIGYRFYFDESTQKKVYEGAMHIFLADLAGEHRQLTSGEHMFRNPVFSTDQKSIAYYYAENLGVRQYQLMIMNNDGGEPISLYDKVAPDSILHWR